MSKGTLNGLTDNPSCRVSKLLFKILLNGLTESELKGCVKVEVTVLGFPAVLMSLTVFVDVKQKFSHAYIGAGHSLSLICQPTSEDMKLYIVIIITD